MATPKRGILAILAKPDDDDEAESEGGGMGREDRLAAAEECVAALKSGDAEAFLDALDAVLDLRGD